MGRATRFPSGVSELLKMGSVRYFVGTLVSATISRQSEAFLRARGCARGWVAGIDRFSPLREAKSMKLDKRKAVPFGFLGVVWFVVSYLVSRSLPIAIASVALVVFLAIALYALDRGCGR